VARARTDITEERMACIIRVTRIGELGRTLAVTSNRNSPTLVTLMMETIRSSETSFLQEPHDVTFQKTAFFIVTVVETSDLI
jgi:hypothetical protein